MRSLRSSSLVLLACVLLLAPVVGCGSKKGPATIAEQLERARKQGTPEGRARDLVRIAGLLVTAGDRTTAAKTLAEARKEVPAEGQALVCVPILVGIAEGYADLNQKAQAREAVAAAATMAAAIEDPLGKAQMLAQVGAVQGAKDGGLGDPGAAETTLQAAEAASKDVGERFRAKALAAVATGYADAGLGKEAAGIAATLEELAAGINELRPKAEAFAAAAAVRAAGGDKEGAAALLAEAAKAAKAISDLPANRAYALVAVAKAFVANGDKKQALALLDEADKAAGKVGDPQQQKDAMQVVRGLQGKLKR